MSVAPRLAQGNFVGGVRFNDGDAGGMSDGRCPESDAISSFMNLFSFDPIPMTRDGLANLLSFFGDLAKPLSRGSMVAGVKEEVVADSFASVMGMDEKFSTKKVERNGESEQSQLGSSKNRMCGSAPRDLEEKFGESEEMNRVGKLVGSRVKLILPSQTKNSVDPAKDISFGQRVKFCLLEACLSSSSVHSQDGPLFSQFCRPKMGELSKGQSSSFFWGVSSAHLLESQLCC